MIRAFLRRALFLIVPALLPAAASGTVIHVPADQPTIQDGIDHATAGDTVLVAPGTYSGTGNRNLDFGGLAIVVLAEAGPGTTVIDGKSDTDGEASAFIFHSVEYPTSVVDGFSIMNFRAPLRISFGNSGGGIFIDGSHPTITHCDFENNVADGGNGGGIALVNGATPVISYCTFRNNYTNNYGSAIYCTQDSYALILGCIMDRNTGDGTIGVSGASPTIEDCMIVQAAPVDSRGGAALLFESTSFVTVINCVITGNRIGGTFSRGGAALRMNDTAVASFTSCTFAGNYAADVGGAILLAPGSNAALVLSQCVVWGNCAGNGGNEIYKDSFGGTIQIICSDIDKTGVTGTNITYDADTVFDNPFFCGPEDCAASPTPSGDYTLAMNSPALEANNACGLTMGALGMGCGDMTPSRPITWGALKSRYLGKP